MRDTPGSARIDYRQGMRIRLKATGEIIDGVGWFGFCHWARAWVGPHDATGGWCHWHASEFDVLVVDERLSPSAPSMTHRGARQLQLQAGETRTITLSLTAPSVTQRRRGS
jgi:hypothetical protein